MLEGVAGYRQGCVFKCSRLAVPLQVVLVSATLPHEVLEMTHKVEEGDRCCGLPPRAAQYLQWHLCPAARCQFWPSLLCQPHLGNGAAEIVPSPRLRAHPPPGQFMTDPVRILVKRDELTLEGIKQFFVAVRREGCAGRQGAYMHAAAGTSCLW